MGWLFGELGRNGQRDSFWEGCSFIESCWLMMDSLFLKLETARSGCSARPPDIGCLSPPSAKRWIVQIKAPHDKFWRKFPPYDCAWLSSLLIKPSPALGVIPGETESLGTHGRQWPAKGYLAPRMILASFRSRCWTIYSFIRHLSHGSQTMGQVVWGPWEGCQPSSALAGLVEAGAIPAWKAPRWKLLSCKDITQVEKEWLAHDVLQNDASLPWAVELLGTACSNIL